MHEQLDLLLQAELTSSCGFTLCRAERWSALCKTKHWYHSKHRLGLASSPSLLQGYATPLGTYKIVITTLWCCHKWAHLHVTSPSGIPQGFLSLLVKRRQSGAAQSLRLLMGAEFFHSSLSVKPGQAVTNKVTHSSWFHSWAKALSQHQDSPPSPGAPGSCCKSCDSPHADRRNEGEFEKLGNNLLCHIICFIEWRFHSLHIWKPFSWKGQICSYKFQLDIVS